MSSDQWYAQRKAWRENRLKIIKILSKHSLSFKELIEESGLSRSRVNVHLKALADQGIVKKEYKDGKLLNVLQIGKIDLVEYFLGQLEEIGVPKEIAQKGRAFLTADAVAFSGVFCGFLAAEFIRLPNWILEKQHKKLKKEDKIGPPLPHQIFAVPPKAPQVKLQSADAEKREIFAEISPQIFHIALSEYYFEGPSSLEKTETRSRFTIYDGLRMNREIKEAYDKCLDWWLKEVSPYLPLSGFLQNALYFYSKIADLFDRRMLILKY